MKVLVINPIMYTSETRLIKRASTIKDSMMYDFCLAFHNLGHDVTLVGGEPFKPTNEEQYPFKVLWWNCYFKKIFLPHCLPFMPMTYKYIRKNRDNFDLIISSEVFSINSLLAYKAAPNKIIIWHELAKHNSMMHKIPSKIWYGIIAKSLMKNAKVVARSQEAKEFISKYCVNTDDTIIDHGVNLDKFQMCKDKENSFVVCSQLIERKRIDGIIRKFANYLKKFNPDFILYIIGEGNLSDNLILLVKELKIESNVIFTGKMNHQELLPILSKSKALLVNTIKDNNMVSIVESISVATPILSTNIPLNSTYINKYKLGIAKKEWDENDLNEIVINNKFYVKNCITYREGLSTKERVKQFINIKNNM